MLSPAQPQRPAQPSRSGKEMHYFSLLFSPKIFKEREIMLFQNRKNKIVFGSKIPNGTYQKCLFWFRVLSIKVYAFLQRLSREFKYPRRDFRLGYMFRFLPFCGYAFYAKLRVLVHYELPKTPLSALRNS